MKTNPKQKALTFGDLIEGGYRACGKRRATGIIRLAAHTHLVAFRGPRPRYDFFKET
jgi:hypothetical protein